ncbi:MAG: glycoside hydrolase family 3 protein [Bacilli bacterium]|nr:glycoside hydrolase family 3 protein [Bacilli bacterium]
MKKKLPLLRGLAASSALLMATMAFSSSLLFKWEGQVSIALGVFGSTVTTDSYYSVDYPSREEYLKASDAHDVQTEEEGAVLLKNKNNALPLKTNERRVTLFGRASVDPYYRGNSGGSAFDESRRVTYINALKAEGLELNQTLLDAYSASSTGRVKVAVENKDGAKSSIGEEGASFYTDELKNSYASDYNDAAIVLFARDGGEGRDLFAEDADGVSQLSLHQAEADLLRMVKDSGKFSKIIVLINSSYPMELGFLDQEEYGVDAALWIGGPGLKGFTGVANLLVGKTDPSGHLVDTFATDSLSSAAVQNAFNYGRFTNLAANYVVEAEGIYVGYRYYETRYHDQVKGLHNATSSKGAFVGATWDYAKEVAYPFGYGDSYAAFSQEVKSIEWDRAAHKVKAVVKVTNNGVASGSSYTGKSKSAVQLYVCSPYEAGQAEKSAIQLIDFGKTALLAKGESEEVTIECEDYLFATYDEAATNGADTSKKGCYVFDKGDYYFAVGDSAHDALNNVLAAEGASNMFDHAGNPVPGAANKTVKVSLSETDNVTYAKSVETGAVVSNRLDELNINHFYDADPVTYLTRGDWNTFPSTYRDLAATDEMIALRNGLTYTQPTGGPEYTSITTGVDSGIKYVEMREVPFDDAKWDTFLDQLTISDMCAMVGENFGQPAVESVAKPQNYNSDGPCGPQGSKVTVHVNEVVAAATFNKEILRDRGLFIGQDCIYNGVTQIWGPGCNIHRTPFSGRNFEYYSEDSVLSYICSAIQCKAMQEKGANAAPKHFAGNDQETNRTSLCVFTTEQAYRQGPLKGFEGAFTKGGALATMMSTSDAGLTNFYGAKAILTDILRGEWGFKGITITDSVASWGTNNPTLACFAAGTDTFNARSACGSELKKHIVQKKDGFLLSRLRETAHRFFYSMSRSNNINGLTSESVVANQAPWWKGAVNAVNLSWLILTGIAIVGTVVYAVIPSRKGE